MSDANEDVKISLKVMVNRQKTKVVFAEVDSSFADVLLSFLTLPLGRIVRILKNHYGDEAPAFGSLTTLYNGLANLDSVHFWTQGAKSILLHPRSSSDAQCKSLKLDISDSSPLECFVCERCDEVINSVSMYHDSSNIGRCIYCSSKMKKELAKKCPQIGDGVLTISSASFLISDNLQIVPNTGLVQVLSVLGTTDMDNIVQLNNVSFGFAEVMDLLKASLISSTPLSDVILKKTGQMNSATRKNGLTEKGSTSNSKKMNLKVIVQKSTNKFLYAEAEEDFVEFLFGLLIIPLGGVECLLSRNSSIKAIENLYTSVADLINAKYFKNPLTKNRLINPTIPYGYVSKNYVLPLTQQSLPPAVYKEFHWGPSLNFPKGQGNYLLGPKTYKVEDDLTVTPFCFASIISYLNELKIPISDVNELQLEIGLEEGLSILKASLTSTSALTDALFSHTSNKRPKQEQA